MAEVKWKVMVPQEMALGEFANAFRIIGDGPEDVFLDFVLASPNSPTARLVSRVRVNRKLMVAIAERFKFSATPVEVEDPVVDPTVN